MTAMSSGILDLLTVIPVEKLLPPIHRLQWVVERGMPLSETAFWKNFARMWCDVCEISCCNISGILADTLEIVHRTNNPLEAYTWRLAEEMGASPPSLLHFAQVLKEEASRYLALLADVRRHRHSVLHPALIPIFLTFIM
eukprot:jgi/Phyca11/127403/e_gw1.68.111.1